MNIQTSTISMIFEFHIYIQNFQPFLDKLLIWCDSTLIMLNKICKYEVLITSSLTTISTHFKCILQYEIRNVTSKIYIPTVLLFRVNDTNVSFFNAKIKILLSSERVLHKACDLHVSCVCGCPYWEQRGNTCLHQLYFTICDVLRRHGVELPSTR